MDNKEFDLWADGYDKAVGISDDNGTYPFAGYRNVMNGIFQTIMEKPGASVLDIGFGTGTLTTKLYENGCVIYGQDFSERMIEIALKKMPNAKLYQGDFSEGLVEPLAAKQYDFIVATYALHHVDDNLKVRFINELKRHLNPDGRILIGDVAFETRKDMELCAQMAGDEWDDEEFYFVIDELKKVFPGLEFAKLSHCAGILTLA